MRQTNVSYLLKKTSFFFFFFNFTQINVLNLDGSGNNLIFFFLRQLKFETVA